MDHPVRLLVVDDHPETHEMTDLMFGEGQVVHAYNGKEGLAALASSPDLDAVVLDLAMPVLDGFGFLEALRNDRRLPEVPVCVFTANREEATRSLELGARDFVDKRAHYDEFKLRLLNLVAAHRRGLAAQRVKTDFLAVVSHELKTPMHGIMGMAEAIRDGSLSPEQSQYLDILEQSSRRMMDLVEDVLAFLGSDHPLHARPRVSFSPRAVVQRVLDGVLAAAARNGTRVEVLWAAGLPDEVSGLPDQMSLVLHHLVANAVKFTDRGKVVVSVEPGDGEVGLTFTVRDTGIGFPEGWQSRLGEPFAQGDGSETRRFGGLGLGLAIASRVVHLLGGTLTVDSEAGRGSVVRFTC